MKIEFVNKTQARLLEDVSVSVKGTLITVKNGMIFDGASIPKVFWPIIGSPFTGRYRLAALIHDSLYRSEALSRRECDEVFLILMERCRVSYWRRALMYYAVRIGGKLAWNSHTKESLKNNRQFIRIEK